MTRLLVGWGSSSVYGIGPALDSVLADTPVRFVNEGRGGETSHHSAARLGSLPVAVSVAGGALPSAGTVRLRETPLVQNAPALKAFAGEAASVPGVVHGDEERLFFTRQSPGDAVAVDASPFLPRVGHRLRGEDTLLWMGKNDLVRGASAEEVIARTDGSAEWVRRGGGRAVVIGHFVNTASDPETREKVLAVNAAHAGRYGDRFVDVQGFVTSEEVWSVTGLTPTAEDRAEQHLGHKPPSLSSDPGHFDMAGYLAVARLLRRRLDVLGWLS